MKSVHGGKVKNDKVDLKKIATYCATIFSPWPIRIPERCVRPEPRASWRIASPSRPILDLMFND
ncbi:MAG: hypothetical protein GWN41_02200 [Phycisphaerae bacterium]|nr:hypothetical protein [Phycisphaerae bacterium]